MHELRFGVSLTPTTDVEANRAFAVAAEDGGLDLIGIQDHPYVAGFLDTFVVAGDVLANTSRISVFPDVANLPLRPPAVLAKTAAALDIISGGRFELALGAGGYWDAITRMGVPKRTSREANLALREAVTILRSLWTPGPRSVDVDGEYYQVSHLQPGPIPAHPIEIWSGAQGPKALQLAGEIADGWAAPIPSYLPYEQWPEANRILDEAATAAGRDPSAVRRIAQVVGTVTDAPGQIAVANGDAPVRGTADQWANVLADLGSKQPFTTFVFWPEQQTTEQVTAFAEGVVPEVRRHLG